MGGFVPRGAGDGRLSVTKLVTKVAPVTKLVTKLGRPLKGAAVMSAADRMRAMRERRKQA